MENSRFDKKNAHWSGPLLIARDTLIFLTCVLVVVLIYVTSPQTFKSAASSNMTVSSDLSSQPPNTTNSLTPQTEAPQTNTALAADAAAVAETPVLTPEPTPTPVL